MSVMSVEAMESRLLTALFAAYPISLCVVYFLSYIYLVVQFTWGTEICASPKSMRRSDRLLCWLNVTFCATLVLIDLLLVVLSNCLY